MRLIKWQRLEEEWANGKLELEDIIIRQFQKLLGIVVLSLNDWRNLKISKIEKGSQYNLFHHHHRK